MAELPERSHKFLAGYSLEAGLRAIENDRGEEDKF